MFAVLMATFALVTAVVALGGAWLTMSASATTRRDTQSLISNLAGQIAKSSGTQLKVEVDALAGALEAMRASNRREFGSLWGRQGGRPKDDIGGLHDPEFEAMIAAQQGRPGNALDLDPSKR